MAERDFETLVLPNGIGVHLHRTQKFKTVTVRLFIHHALSRETAAKTALLPMVLRRGTQRYPTIRQLTKNLESLYGAEIDTGVLKIGEHHIIFVHLELPNENYLADGPGNLLDQAMQVMSEIVLKPVLEDNLLLKDYVAQEKDNLRKLQLSLINDKAQYALSRCVEEMCREERFGVTRYGKPEDLEGTDAASLTDHYRHILSGCPMDIYIVGDVPSEKGRDLAGRFFNIPRPAQKPIEPTVVVREPSGVRNVVEKQHVTQAKLALGYRTGRTRKDEGFWPLAFCDAVLGGFPHSKLFKNVREEAGLAYYAYSRLEGTKGLATISCGIDYAAYEQAKDIITDQVDQLKTGKISDEEMDYTLRGMVSRIKMSEDSATGKVLRHLEGSINGVREEVTDVIGNLEKITRDDVVEAAQGLALDTVYLLTRQDSQEVKS